MTQAAVNRSEMAERWALAVEKISGTNIRLKILVSPSPAGGSILTVTGLDSFEENLFYEALG